jgi:hypothetical protein
MLQGGGIDKVVLPGGDEVFRQLFLREEAGGGKSRQKPQGKKKKQRRRQHEACAGFEREIFHALFYF